jgi:hypothetical protein
MKPVGCLNKLTLPQQQGCLPTIMYATSLTPKMKRAILLLVFCILSNFAKAELLIDPANSVLLQSSGTYDNVVSANRSLGFTGTFFGTPHQTVDVSTNGNFNFNSDATFSNTPMPTK